MAALTKDAANGLVTLPGAWIELPEVLAHPTAAVRNASEQLTPLWAVPRSHSAPEVVVATAYAGGPAVVFVTQTRRLRVRRGRDWVARQGDPGT